VTNASDALACYRNGVDAIGMLIRKPGDPIKAGSTRIPVEAAAALADAVRGRIESVLLAHVSTRAELSVLYQSIRPSAMQVQCDVPPEDLAALKRAHPQLQVIKTFRVADGVSANAVLAEIRPYLAVASIDAVLLDSKYGGSGEKHDWRISAAVVEALKGVPCLLAGGLNASNVASALRQVAPFGVDAMSSLAEENNPKKKDHDKLREFAASVRGGKTK
jgi:phosphoribosylanthranilate isomerase